MPLRRRVEEPVRGAQRVEVFGRTRAAAQPDALRDRDRPPQPAALVAARHALAAVGDSLGTEVAPVAPEPTFQTSDNIALQFPPGTQVDPDTLRDALQAKLRELKAKFSGTSLEEARPPSAPPSSLPSSSLSPSPAWDL